MLVAWIATGRHCFHFIKQLNFSPGLISESHIFKHDSQGGRVTALRSGLYLTMNREEMIMNQDTSKMCYVFYWPEEATWDDKAAAFSSTIRRNRETFMRYEIFSRISLQPLI
jgi:hypothetical protein